VSKKYNQLKSRERFDLWRYIDDNRGMVLHDTDAETAKKATEALGFQVSDNNVIAAREGLHIKKNTGRPATAKMAELEDRVDQIEEFLRKEWGYGL
jgi:hypothetical protein